MFLTVNLCFLPTNLPSIWKFYKRIKFIYLFIYLGLFEQKSFLYCYFYIIQRIVMKIIFVWLFLFFETFKALTKVIKPMVNIKSGRDTSPTVDYTSSVSHHFTFMKGWFILSPQIKKIRQNREETSLIGWRIHTYTMSNFRYVVNPSEIYHLLKKLL